MKFDVRKHQFVQKCGATSKRMFKSHEQGLQFIAGLEDAPDMRCYKCKFCGQWHLTSQPIMA